MFSSPAPSKIGRPGKGTHLAFLPDAGHCSHFSRLRQEIEALSWWLSQVTQVEVTGCHVHFPWRGALCRARGLASAWA